MLLSFSLCGVRIDNIECCLVALFWSSCVKEIFCIVALQLVFSTRINRLSAVLSAVHYSASVYIGLNGPRPEYSGNIYVSASAHAHCATYFGASQQPGFQQKASRCTGWYRLAILNSERR